MREKLDKHRRDAAVSRVAERQHGVITREQLRNLGLTDDAIGRRVRSGHLHRIYRGVYAVGHPRLTTKGRFLAAVLACGPRAVLSHRSAAVLWGLLPERGPRIDVTVPSGGGRKRRGALIVHRSPLAGSEVTVRDAIPVTTPVRTVLDLADVLPRRRFERALEEAAYLRLDLDGLRPRRGRRGAGLLGRVLADHDVGTTRTRSELEERMLALCRRAGLPLPEVNRRVEGYEADFVWIDATLIVETDGWAAHGTRAAFERDRLRDAEHVAAGWRVVRVTKRRLERDPEAVAGQLTRLLAHQRHLAV
jgi:very-short-patch-repair endonuclease